MSWVSNLWRSNPKEPEDEPKEVINKLFNRVNTSTLLQDRRDSLKSLATLTKNYSYLITVEHIDVIIDLFNQDKEDNEMVGLSLRLILDIMTHNCADLTCHKTVLYSPNTLSGVMGMLSNGDNHIRRYSLDILHSLASEFWKELPGLMLAQSSAIFSVLTDLLEDKWDFLRCSALSLLTKLTRLDEDVQKLVVFDNGFPRAVDMIRLEGFSAGGNVVEDALSLMLNLVRDNSPSKVAFCEGASLRDFVGFLTSLVEFTEQNKRCVLLALSVVGELVAQQNTRLSLRRFQMHIAKSGLLKVLVDLAFRPDLPGDLFLSFVGTVSSAVRGCNHSQDVLENSFMPLSGKLFVNTLTTWALDGERGLRQRQVITNCLRAFIEDNHKAKDALIKTFLPSTVKSGGNSTGRILCGGLLSTDHVAVFICTDLIMTCLSDDCLKNDLLRVQLSTSTHLPPTLLLYHCADIMMKDLSLLVTGGMAMFLATWVEGSHNCVHLVLKMHNFMNFLIGHVCSGEPHSLSTGLCSVLLALLLVHNQDTVPEFSRKSILHFIERGCGSVQCFFDRIYIFSRSMLFLSCYSSPDISLLQDSLCLDPNFLRVVNRSLGDFEKIDSAGSIVEGKGMENSEVCSVTVNGDIQKQLDDLCESKVQMENCHRAEVDGLVAQIAYTEAQLHSLQGDLSRWNSAYCAKQEEAAQLRVCYDHLKAEHDDLLVFLAEREM